MKQVLIVEDDPVMLRGLCDNFRREGYSVQVATDGAAGLDAALETRPDLLVLDVMLPILNGYEICRSLREEKITVPTILLTAKNEEADLLLGFGVGADDYVTKPFSVRELLARCDALLRRSGNPEPATLRVGDYELDRSGRQLRRLSDGSDIPLSPKEYGLLEYFIERPDHALSREQIMNAVWGYGCLVTHRSIDRFVTGLRKKIEPQPEFPRHILTVREFGYKFRR